MRGYWFLLLETSAATRRPPLHHYYLLAICLPSYFTFTISFFLTHLSFTLMYPLPTEPPLASINLLILFSSANCKTQSKDVDGRCDGEWDEYQGSESGNKPLRQGRIDVSLWKILYEPRAFTLSKRKSTLRVELTLCSGNVLVHDSRRPLISLSEPEEQKLY